MNKIILSADSTCDLNHEIINYYDVQQYPYTILIGEDSYKDNVDITPQDIYRIYEETKVLPKTSAINVAEYYNYFKPWVDEGYEVIHINLGSSLTSAYNNCQLAANELKGVYSIDSQNLSGGSGILVLKAGQMIEEGFSAGEISEKLKGHRKNIHTSFVLDTLEFLYAGGRCSKIASLGSNLLRIKPEINVDNSSGAMSPGCKYKGSLDKVIVKYINKKLSSYDNINDEFIFLIHSGMDNKYIDIAKDAIRENINFDKIYTSVASCTISSHCGPNTLGIIFETK